MKRGLVAVLCAWASIGFGEEPRGWDIVMDESAVRFRAEQAGAEFEGGFDEFEAEIRFDPLDLARSSARVEISVNSINTQSPDRDEVLRSEQWFHPERWPRAVFRTTAFRHAADGGYEALAELTIRGVTRGVMLGFDFTRLANGGERLEGQVTINRLEFGLGEGEWADTDWIGDRVTVVVRIVRAADTGD